MIHYALHIGTIDLFTEKDVEKYFQGIDVCNRLVGLCAGFGEVVLATL